MARPGADAVLGIRGVAYRGMVMSEVKRTPVTWFLERLMCECGGEFRSTGMILTSNPCQYSMQCDKCGAGETRYENYPRVMWEIVPTAQEPAASETQRTPDAV